MPKEDYLIKQIEKFVQVIAVLLGLGKKGKNIEIVNIAEHSVGELLENPFPTIRELDCIAQIYNILGNSYNELLQTEKAQNAYQKSLFYYQKLIEKDRTFSFERENIICELKNKIL